MNTTLSLADLPKAPAHTTGRIYWHKGGKSGDAFVLCGYCPNTLAKFLSLYQWAQERVGEIGLHGCTCGKITKSRDIQGFTYVSFLVDGPVRNIPDFENYTTPIDFNF